MKKILLIFLVLIFKNALLAQNPNDCVNAIVVCGNGVFSSNANGPGKLEVSGCGNSSESNSLWIKINVIQAGQLGFDLIPNDKDINTDFDFWVYGPNKACPTTADSPIRCCRTNPVQAGLTSNITGINGSTLATTAWSGSGGNGLPYVRWLDVKAGEFYYIAIDRPYSTTSGDTGFQIKWTGTATAGAGAFPAQPTANKIADLVTCTSSTVGFFNLDNTIRSMINSDITNNTITFHPTLADATDGKNPISGIVSVNIGSPKAIYAKVVNNIVSDPASGCFQISDFKLRVFPVPTAGISVLPTQVCAGGDVTVTFTGTPGATVDYTVDGGAVKSGLLSADNGTFVFTEQVSVDRTYALTRAKIVDGNGKEVCFTAYAPPLIATVKVNPLPTISGTLTICQSGTSQLTASPAPTGSFLWTSSDTAIATVDAAGLVTGVAVGTSNITYKDNNGCSATSAVTITAAPTINGKSSICVNTSTQLTGSGTPATSNPWSSSDSTIATVSSSGMVDGLSIGTVVITYTDIAGCSAVFNLEVKASNNTQTATAEVSNYFSDNMTITVTVVGDAIAYLYSLDGGPFQTSNVFTHVSPGLHSVTINDTQGCTDITIDNILAIGYPHFVTPNNDGYNDTWNITSLADLQPNAEIFIFDRYGKLLKRITPGGAGWDGTYNGQQMPASDYWFTVKYIENGTQKSFKSHFSLKR